MNDLRRVTNIKPGRIEYKSNVITLTGYRAGVEHVTRIHLGSADHYSACELCRAGRSHIATVVEGRARAWRSANEALVEVGGGAKWAPR